VESPTTARVVNLEETVQLFVEALYFDNDRLIDVSTLLFIA
jgi:hypothetical protein